MATKKKTKDPVDTLLLVLEKRIENLRKKVTRLEVVLNDCAGALTEIDETRVNLEDDLWDFRQNRGTLS